MATPAERERMRRGQQLAAVFENFCHPPRKVGLSRRAAWEAAKDWYFRQYGPDQPLLPAHQYVEQQLAVIRDLRAQGHPGQAWGRADALVERLGGISGSGGRSEIVATDLAELLLEKSQSILDTSLGSPVESLVGDDLAQVLAIGDTLKDPRLTDRSRLLLAEANYKEASYKESTIAYETAATETRDPNIMVASWSAQALSFAKIGDIHAFDEALKRTECALERNHPTSNVHAWCKERIGRGSAYLHHGAQAEAQIAEAEVIARQGDALDIGLHVGLERTKLAIACTGYGGGYSQDILAIWRDVKRLATTGSRHRVIAEADLLVEPLLVGTVDQ
jgi:hypothetical protein